MALELNGTTGVSLVQDGVVSTDDIAANAVTAAKLASTLDLTGKTVTLPAGTGGKVLQIKYSSNVNGSTDTTSSSYAEVNSSYRVSITPISATSRIHLFFYYGAAIGTGTRMGVRFYKSTDGGSTFNPLGSTNTDESHRNDTGNYIINKVTTMEQDSDVTGGARIYTMYFNRPLGSSTARINDNSGGSRLVAMEIEE